MLRWKELFHISERLKQIKSKILVLGGLCVLLGRDHAQLSPVLVENLWVVGLPCTNIDDINGHTIYTRFSDIVVLKEKINWMRKV